MAETLKARVPSELLLAQAHVVIADAERYEQECLAVDSPCEKFEVPVVDYTWLHRWRRQFAFTAQSANCKYKVSHAKLERRLGVAWRNATRLLVLFSLLFPLAGVLKFVSIDEKPFWFNAIGAMKIFARRGSAKKHAKEKRQAMLERWAGMSTCNSWVASPVSFPSGPRCSRPPGTVPAPTSRTPTRQIA